MKRIINLVLISIIFIIGTFSFVNAAVTENSIFFDMTPMNNSIGGEDSEGLGEVEINDILLYAKEAMFSLFYIVAVGVFIFLGIKLMAARGNAEEFKKALMGFVYAIVGIVTIPLAYVLVSLVSGINF